MFRCNPPFGYEIAAPTIGEAWMGMMDAVIGHGVKSFDEQRGRLALQNVRVRSETQIVPDPLVDQFGSSSNLRQMVAMTFVEPTMTDIDVTPSFRVGAKSYYERLRAGAMLEFVIRRLALIPESKKAVVVFPTYEDYAAVLNNPTDDYLPCMVAVQFRVVGRQLRTTAFFRSLDVYQKSYANLHVIAMLTAHVVSHLNESRATGKVQYVAGALDVLITDAHIYSNTLKEAANVVSEYHGSYKSSLTDSGIWVGA